MAETFSLAMTFPIVGLRRQQEIRDSADPAPDGCPPEPVAKTAPNEVLNRQRLGKYGRRWSTFVDVENDRARCDLGSRDGYADCGLGAVPACVTLRRAVVRSASTHPEVSPRLARIQRGPAWAGFLDSRDMQHPCLTGRERLAASTRNASEARATGRGRCCACGPPRASWRACVGRQHRPPVVCGVVARISRRPGWRWSDCWYRLGARRRPCHEQMAPVGGSDNKQRSGAERQGDDPPGRRCRRGTQWRRIGGSDDVPRLAHDRLG